MHSHLSLDDTISAVASAWGSGLRGIVRISGPQTVDVLSRIFQCREGNLSDHNLPTVVAGDIRMPAPFPSVPGDVYLWPTARSYTRQPSAEIHTIGSAPILDTIVEALCRAGARLAEAGEFTMRAFLAGRLDLTQAEAVLGVIDAQTQSDLDVALGQLAGGLRTPLNELREDLLDLLSHLEAGLDFVDEDIEFITVEYLTSQLQATLAKCRHIEWTMRQRSESTDYFRVVLMGAPNVGKSSLLNALAESNTAIVSDLAGTTRDYVSRPVEIHKLPCLLVDTAGVQGFPDGDLEKSAQTVTQEQSRQAHLQLFCLDATRPLNEWERTQIAATNDIDRIFVLTKCDAPRATDFRASAVATSSVDGHGLEQLRDAMRDRLLATATRSPASVSLTSARCRECLRTACENLESAVEAAMNQLGEELVAAELRSSLEHLGQVVGTVYTDDVLDRVFSRFCIGK